MKKNVMCFLCMVVAAVLSLPVQAQVLATKNGEPRMKVMKQKPSLSQAKAEFAKRVASGDKAAAAMAVGKKHEKAAAAKQQRLMTTPLRPDEGAEVWKPFAYGVQPVPMKTFRASGEVTDGHGIIVSPANGQRQVYSRSGWCMVNNEGLHVLEQTGTVHVVSCDDGTVYIRNILASYPTGAWVKGQRSGQTISVPTRQPIYYNDLAEVTYSMGWCIYEPDWESYSSYNEYADALTFSVDDEAGTITLQDSSREIFVALLWDDDDAFAWHGDWLSVWTYEQEFEPMPVVEVATPSDLQTENWYVRGHKVVMEKRQMVKGNVAVGFAGNEVYLKGVFAGFPDAWMKGTLTDGVVTFDGLQLLGSQGGEPVYAAGTSSGDLVAFTMTFDEEQKVLQSTTGLVANTSTTDLAAIDAYSDITIQLSDPFAPIVTLPYTNSLGTEDEWEWFTVIDNNNDGKTWQIYDNQASCEYHSDHNADDWLISAAFQLEAGKTYTLKLDACCSSMAYEETIEVRMGQTVSAEAMTGEVIPVTNLNSETPVTLENKLISVSQTGVYYFGIHAMSEADRGSTRAANFVLDETILEAPAAVTDFTATASSEDLSVELYFKTPVVNVGGDLLTESMTVELTRDGELIESFLDMTPGTEFTFVDRDVPVGSHVYTLTTRNSHGKGESVSRTVVLTTIFDVPYVGDFSEPDTYSLFATIDANDDRCSWADNSPHAAYEYSVDNNADDYLITPGLRMEAGKNYAITVTAEAGGNYTERFEVLVGRAATVEALKTQAIGPSELTGDEPAPVDFEGSFECTESGVYYVAVHCISDADMYELWIHKIAVEVGALSTAPAAPALTVTPAALGGLQAVVSVTAPTTAADGSPLVLDSETKIELYRDNQVINTFTSIQLGSTYQYTDAADDLTIGKHTYQAVAYNANGIGKKSDKVTVYIGTDMPADVTGVKAEDRLSSVLLSWDQVPSTGVNGGYVDVDRVNYKVWACEPNSTWVDDSEPVATVIGTPSCEVPFATNEGEQGYQAWVVTASNDAGESFMSAESLVSILIGKPYDLPVAEGFAEGMFHYYCDYVGVPLVFSLSSDNDGVALALTSSQTNGAVAFTTGKLNIKEAANPVLMVDVASYGAEDFSVIASTNGQDAEVLATDASLSYNYKTVSVPLNTLKDADYVMLGFMARIPNASVFDDWTGELMEEGDALIIDNIRIIDQYQNNLAIELYAPETLQKGDASDIVAVVTNWGEKTAKNYTVTIKQGDQVLAQETVADELAPFGKWSLVTPLTTTVLEEADQLNVSASVEYAADENAKDNTAEAVVELMESVAPAPENLVARSFGDAGVDLSWVAPSATVEYTESFESGMGGWKTIDADGDGFNWSYSKYGETDNYMQTRSGLGSVYSESFSNSAIQALTPDNWLISPKLVLDGTFSFYAVGQDENWCDEHFAVFVCTADPTNLDAWQQVSEEYVAYDSFSEYNVDLSEYGGQMGYVAIRHYNVSDMFALVIDDITYTMGGQPEKYNIYCDGQLVATVEGSQTTYTLAAENLKSGRSTFGVSAVYDNGQESSAAKATVNVTTSIAQIVGSKRPVDVYTVDGKLVRRQTNTLNGLKGVYVVEGQTIMVK